MLAPRQVSPSKVTVLSGFGGVLGAVGGAGPEVVRMSRASSTAACVVRATGSASSPKPLKAPVSMRTQ